MSLATGQSPDHSGSQERNLSYSRREIPEVSWEPIHRDSSSSRRRVSPAIGAGDRCECAISPGNFLVFEGKRRSLTAQLNVIFRGRWALIVRDSRHKESRGVIHLAASARLQNVSGSVCRGQTSIRMMESSGRWRPIEIVRDITMIYSRLEAGITGRESL